MSEDKEKFLMWLGLMSLNYGDSFFFVEKNLVMLMLEVKDMYSEYVFRFFFEENKGLMIK